jgi:hypothetical protein
MIRTKHAETKLRSSIHELIVSMYRRLNTPYSKRMYENLRDDPRKLFLDYPKPPTASYDMNVETYCRDYLAYNLVRKTDFYDVGINRQEAAMLSWLKNEQLMETKNLDLVDLCHQRGRTAILMIAARKITNLLGKFSWDPVVAQMQVTSGASTRCPRKRGAPGFKLAGKPHCTRELQPLANFFLYTDPVYMKDLLEAGPVHPRSLTAVVETARFDLVPKDYKVMRPINIEPEINMIFQRGIGRVIRDKLRHVGINLNDQSYNQYLALVGSRTGSLVTIDLESASDSVSKRLVQELLPWDWYQALDLVRSKAVEINGTRHYLSKFSSMGNGFTFELETLVFWSLSSAVCDYYGCTDRRIAVYGDDIVVHNSYADHLIDVLDVCGFRTNKEKTFLKGPFRESCGKHYFIGRDVTPFNYKKSRLDVTDYLLLLNSWNLWSERCGVLHRIPKIGIAADLPSTPPSFGLRSGFVERLNPYKTCKSGVFTFRHLAYAGKAVRVPPFGQYWATLLSPSSEAIRSEVVEPSRRLVTRVTSTSFWD